MKFIFSLVLLSKKLEKQVRRYTITLKGHSLTISQPVELSETPSYIRAHMNGEGDSDMQAQHP